MANNGRSTTKSRLETDKTIIYHSPCFDGFCAAWLCYGFWPNATYIARQYGQPIPDDEYINNKDILIVDFSYTRDIIIDIHQRANSLQVIDHHKTAASELIGLPYCLFDMNKSGARLTWEYLNNLGYHPPTGSCGIHWLVAYIEDNDLWLHELPNSVEINAAIQSYPLDFDMWNRISLRKLDDLLIEGIAINRYKDIIIRQHAAFARTTTIEGYNAVIAQCTVGNTISSGLADYLLKLYTDADLAIIVTDTFDGMIYRLRSNKVDVSKIAMAYGGGGHRDAAAFKYHDFYRSSKRLDIK